MLPAKPILEESIYKLYCTSLPTCMKIADLGCSCGPNTLSVTSNIIHIVCETSLRLKVETPTFQIFLNDLFGNDFNSIFKSLPGFYHNLNDQRNTRYFLWHPLSIQFHPFLPFFFLSPLALSGITIIYILNIFIYLFPLVLNVNSLRTKYMITLIFFFVKSNKGN